MLIFPNITSANTLQSSVFPTPVGPQKINVPIGLFGFLRPTLARLTALVNDFIASSWPTILFFNISSKCNNLSDSFSVNLSTGTLVHIETTFAISSSSTVWTSVQLWALHSFLIFSKSSFKILSLSLKLAAFSKSWFLIASSFSLITFSIFNSFCLISGGKVSLEILTLAAASSIKSIALSGIYLSVIYLSAKSTAIYNALSVILTLWCDSYLSLNPNKIFIVSFLVGGSTFTVWNLLSKAASFSICFLYSSIVVAPIHFISPLAKAGFKILDASIAPSAPPAPTIVWISSMKIIISSSFLSSFITFFNLSSNSPLYFAPAIIDVISKTNNLLLLKLSGTSPATIFCANPSIIAVFPTPGSPIKQGLFFILLHNISKTLWVSSSLPITGSSFPSCAFWVKSVLYWSNTGVLFCFFSFCIDFLFSLSSFPEIYLSNSCLIKVKSALLLVKIVKATPSPSFISAINICSGFIKLCPYFLAISKLSSNNLFALGVNNISPVKISSSPNPK